MESVNKGDIQLLCNYLRECLPDLESRSRDLDFAVAEYLTNLLLAQGMKVVDIVQKRTRLTKLVCRYLDTASLAQDGKILPTPVSVSSSGYRSRSFSQSPTGPGSGIDVSSSSHIISPDPQGPIPLYHALRSQQPCRAAEAYTNTGKRRRVSGNEDLQPPTVCSITGQHLSTNIFIRPEHQHSFPSPCEEAGSTEHGSASSTSHVIPHRDLVPISEEVEEIQDRNMPHFDLGGDEIVVGQRLSASRFDTRWSILDNADTQQLSLVDDDLPLLSNSNADADFTSYAIEFVHTLDHDARIAFGLHDSLQYR
jgi:hypothetical protein